jgi:hypothetical protein
MATLEERCEDTVVKALGDLARGVECFMSCGGTVPEVETVNLLYKKPSGVWSSLELPTGLLGGSVQEFFGACSTASFGVGGEAVIDKNYRDALKLEPEHFRTDFEIASTSILNNISSTMSIGSSIRSEPYKLNVYSTGGHFKAHVDTPRSKDMFGSLVVCLPSHFTGGTLVTRNLGRQVTFDWSSPSPATHWAAFFSDVEHEILPVTSGHRITLTYNLYRSSLFHPISFDVTLNPLYVRWLAALQSPHFMRNGGTLGFFCQHKYVETISGEEVDTKNIPFLKGEDMFIYQVAQSLGLSVDLKPICKGDEDNYVIPSFKRHQICSEEDAYEKSRLTDAFSDCGQVETTEGIKWCLWSEEKGYPFLSYMIFGNDPYIHMSYQSAALLVKIPKFTMMRGGTASSTTHHAEEEDHEVKKLQN